VKSINAYMSRHRIVFLMDPSGPNEHKNSTLIQILIALIVSTNIVGYFYYRIHIVGKYKSTMHWHYTTLQYNTLHNATLHYTTLHYTTLRRTTQYTAHIPSWRYACGFYTSSQLFLYIQETKYEQLWACIRNGSLSYNFGVTAYWLYTCQSCVFHNNTFLMNWWRRWGRTITIFVEWERKPTCLFLTISQHVSGIIMPIFRRTRPMLLDVLCCAVTSGES